MNSYRHALTGKIVANPKSFWEAEREERKKLENERANSDYNSQETRKEKKDINTNTNSIIDNINNTNSNNSLGIKK